MMLECRVNNFIVPWNRFYIPSGVWEFTLRIDGCEFTAAHNAGTQDPITTDNVTTRHDYYNGRNNNTVKAENDVCLQNVFVRARALPTNNPNSPEGMVPIGKDSYFLYVENLPETDNYYYLLIVANTRVAYNISISVRGKKSS